MERLETHSVLGIADKHAHARPFALKTCYSLEITLDYVVQRVHERDIAVDWLNYKQVRNSVNYAIRQAERSYYTKGVFT